LLSSKFQTGWIDQTLPNFHLTPNLTCQSVSRAQKKHTKLNLYLVWKVEIVNSWLVHPTHKRGVCQEWAFCYNLDQRTASLQSVLLPCLAVAVEGMTKSLETPTWAATGRCVRACRGACSPLSRLWGGLETGQWAPRQRARPWPRWRNRHFSTDF
jgi:hypothetical protein